MKSLKTFFSTAIIAVMLILAAAVPASAANATLRFSSSNPKVGDNITVTVTVSPHMPMYALEFSLSYNPDVLTYVSSDCTVNAAGAGLIKAAEGGGGKETLRYSFTFTGKAAGSSTIAINGVAAGRDDGDEASFGASASMTVKDASKSSDANLKALSLSAGNLSPAFSAGRTTYTVSVPYETTECKVYATASDSNANVSVSGSAALAVGKNTRSVTVTAASGATKTYTITITRAKEENTASQEPQNNPDTVTTVIAGVTYFLAKDLTDIPLFYGFVATNVEFQGMMVAVAQDEQQHYILYYLKAQSAANDISDRGQTSSQGAKEEKYVPYVLTKDGTFEKLNYISYNGKEYILASLPEGTSMPEQYYPAKVEIGDQTVSAYAVNTEGFSDFYYLYCYYDGEYGFYRYDSKEDVLQRAPEAKLLTWEQAQANTDAKRPFLQRLRALSNNAKRVILGCILLTLAIVALIIWAVVRAIRQRKLQDFHADHLSELFNDQFDDILIEDENTAEQSDSSDDNLIL